MSVLIRGIEMPAQCVSCKLFCFMQFKGEIKDVCNAIGRLLENPYQRPDWCPLVEVPDGRLINADELEQEIQKRFLICEKDGNHFQKPYEAIRAIESAKDINVPIKEEGE